MKRILTALIIATAIPAFGQGWTVMGNPVSLCQGGDPLWILWNDTPYNASNNIYSDVSELGVPPLTYPVITLTMLTNLPPTGAMNTNAWINYYIRYGTNGTDWLGTNGYSDGSDFAVGNNVRFLDHDTNAPGALTVSFPDNVIGGTTGQWYFAAVAQTIGTNGTFDRGYYNTNCIGCQTAVPGQCTWKDMYLNVGGIGCNPAATRINTSGAMVTAGYYSGQVIISGTNYIGDPYGRTQVGCGYVVRYSGTNVIAIKTAVATPTIINEIDDFKLFDMVLDRTNNIYVCGYFSGRYNLFGTNVFSGVDIPYGYNLVQIGFVCKLDPTGNVIWYKPIRGDTSAVWIQSLGLCSNGDVLCAGVLSTVNVDFGGGITLSRGGNEDPWAARLSGSDGTCAWASRVGTNPLTSKPVHMASDASDNSVIVWNTGLAKLNSAGSGQWSRAFATTNGIVCNGVAIETNTGVIYITGGGNNGCDLGGGAVPMPYPLPASDRYYGTFIAGYSTANAYLFASCVASGAGGAIATDNAGRLAYTGHGLFFGVPGQTVIRNLNGVDEQWTAEWAISGTNSPFSVEPIFAKGPLRGTYSSQSFGTAIMYSGNTIYVSGDMEGNISGDWLDYGLGPEFPSLLGRQNSNFHAYTK